MKETIEQRIKELECTADDYYLDSKFRSEAREKIERLKQLLNDLYGF